MPTRLFEYNFATMRDLYGNALTTSMNLIEDGNLDGGALLFSQNGDGGTFHVSSPDIGGSAGTINNVVYEFRGRTRFNNTEARTYAFVNRYLKLYDLDSGNDETRFPGISIHRNGYHLMFINCVIEVITDGGQRGAYREAQNHSRLFSFNGHTDDTGTNLGSSTDINSSSYFGHAFTGVHANDRTISFYGSRVIVANAGPVAMSYTHAENSEFINTIEDNDEFVGRFKMFPTGINLSASAPSTGLTMPTTKNCRFVHYGSTPSANNRFEINHYDSSILFENNNEFTQAHFYNERRTRSVIRGYDAGLGQAPVLYNIGSQNSNTASPYGFYSINPVTRLGERVSSSTLPANRSVKYENKGSGNAFLNAHVIEAIEFQPTLIDIVDNDTDDNPDYIDLELRINNNCLLNGNDMWTPSPSATHVNVYVTGADGRLASHDSGVAGELRENIGTGVNVTDGAVLMPLVVTGGGPSTDTRDSRVSSGFQYTLNARSFTRIPQIALGTNIIRPDDDQVSLIIDHALSNVANTADPIDIEYWPEDPLIHPAAIAARDEAIRAQGANPAVPLGSSTSADVVYFNELFTANTDVTIQSISDVIKWLHATHVSGPANLRDMIHRTPEVFNQTQFVSFGANLTLDPAAANRFDYVPGATTELPGTFTVMAQGFGRRTTNDRVNGINLEGNTLEVMGLTANRLTLDGVSLRANIGTSINTIVIPDGAEMVDLSGITRSSTTPLQIEGISTAVDPTNGNFVAPTDMTNIVISRPPRTITVPIAGRVELLYLEGPTRFGTFIPRTMALEPIEMGGLVYEIPTGDTFADDLTFTAFYKPFNDYANGSYYEVGRFQGISYANGNIQLTARQFSSSVTGSIVPVNTDEFFVATEENDPNVTNGIIVTFSKSTTLPESTDVLNIGRTKGLMMLVTDGTGYIRAAALHAINEPSRDPNLIQPLSGSLGMRLDLITFGVQAIPPTPGSGEMGVLRQTTLTGIVNLVTDGTLSQDLPDQAGVPAFINVPVEGPDAIALRDAVLQAMRQSITDLETPARTDSPSSVMEGLSNIIAEGRETKNATGYLVSDGNGAGTPAPDRLLGIRPKRQGYNPSDDYGDVVEE